jgi:hypothetical protein
VGRAGHRHCAVSGFSDVNGSTSRRGWKSTWLVYPQQAFGP